MYSLANIQRVEDLSPRMRILITGKGLQTIQNYVTDLLSKGSLVYALQEYIDSWRLLSINDKHTIPNIEFLLDWMTGQSPYGEGEITEIRKMVECLSKGQKR